MRTAELPDGVYDTFTSRCAVCGATVRVEDGAEQPHRCRVRLSRATEEGE